MNEFQGQWVRRGGVLVPVPTEKRKAGRPPKKTMWDWSNPDDAKAAHAFFNHGARDLWTVEGERVYQAGRKRVQYARLSATDREWAEKNATRFSWLLTERQNRASMTSTS